MGLGAFISVGRDVGQAVARVQLAEELGYESVFVTHLSARESLTILTWYAARTRHLRLGTGVVPIYTRTPATMAQTAATLDELSGGRLVLGLGVSHRPMVEHWHGQTIDRPLAEIREYVAIVRAILAGEDPPQGEKWRTQFRLTGIAPRPDVPIHLAGLSPKMLELAGEIADGVILWLCAAPYVRDVVVPAVAAGRERAGKSLDGFEIVAAIPSAVTDDPGAVRETLRGDCIPYFRLPFYRAMIERSGFEGDIAAFDRAAAAGDSDAMKAAVSDEFLAVLAAFGDEAAVLAGLRAYVDAGCNSPFLSPVSRTDVDATLRAGAGLL